MAKRVRYNTTITAPNGKKVYINARSPEERDEKVAKKKMELGMGVDIADDTRFDEYAKMWLAVYKAPPRLRPNSYEVVRRNTENHVIPVFGHMKIRDIKPMHIQMFLTSIAGYSASSQGKYFDILRGILDAAEDNGLIAKSPIRKKDHPGGKPAEEEKPLTDDQSRRLLEAVKGTRAYLFCLIALSTGMRRGEILGLMWEDVDFQANLIHVRRSNVFIAGQTDPIISTLLKSDASHRDLPLPPGLRKELIEEKLRSNSPFVIHMLDGRPVSQGSWQSIWDIVTARTVSEKHALGSRVGKTNVVVTLDFHCHPHQLRHTYATGLFNDGADVKEVQALLGHSSPEMTLRIYVHYLAEIRAKGTAEKVAAREQNLKHG